MHSSADCTQPFVAYGCFPSICGECNVFVCFVSRVYFSVVGTE